MPQTQGPAKTQLVIQVHGASKPGKGIQCNPCGQTVDDVTGVGVGEHGSFYCDTCFTLLTNRVLNRFQHLREIGRIPGGLLRKPAKSASATT